MCGKRKGNWDTLFFLKENIEKVMEILLGVKRAILLIFNYPRTNHLSLYN